MSYRKAGDGNVDLEADEDLEDEYVLSLPDEKVLERALSAKNPELVRTIATEESESVPGSPGSSTATSRTSRRR